MEFRIADTFTDSLARLTDDEQKAVKITAFDLQLNPTNPGIHFTAYSMTPLHAPAPGTVCWSQRCHRRPNFSMTCEDGDFFGYAAYTSR